MAIADAHHDAYAYQAKIEVLHMHCIDSLDMLSMRIIHKFYEDKIEKSYLLGRKDAYETVRDILEAQNYDALGLTK